MDAIPQFSYRIQYNPEPQKIGTIELHSSFVIPVHMDLTRSRFSCTLLTKEFIEDYESPHKEELRNFLTISGVEQEDVCMLMSKLIQLALKVSTSVVDGPSHYALLMWLTFFVIPSSEELYYDMNSEFKPASKLRISLLRRRIYREKRETNSNVDKCTNSNVDKCTICLEKLVTGQEIATLPCGHEFHIECIVEWLNFGHVCPLCRMELPYDDDDIPQISTVHP